MGGTAAWLWGSFVEQGLGRRPRTGRGWNAGEQAGWGCSRGPHLFSGVPRRSRIALESLWEKKPHQAGKTHLHLWIAEAQHPRLPFQHCAPRQGCSTRSVNACRVHTWTSGLVGAYGFLSAADGSGPEASEGLFTPQAEFVSSADIQQPGQIDVVR